MTNTQLGKHITASYEAGLRNVQYELAAGIRSLAISVALEEFGADELRALRWLNLGCGLTVATEEYRGLLDMIRVNHVAGEVRS